MPETGTETRWSPDGQYLAYGLSASGSDWVEWKIRDVQTGADLEDHLKWVKFSGASWTKDGSGFFYGSYPAPQDGQKPPRRHVPQTTFQI